MRNASELRAGSAGRTRILALTGVTVCVLLVSCVPWTVVPIETDQQAQGAAFDAAGFVESIWDSRLIPTAREQATDAAAAVKSQSGEAKRSFLAGEGKVVADERSSSSGRLMVDLAPVDGQADLAILTGPVILGTALRDAAGFIEFSQFTNQLDYADVANALNQRVIDEVSAPLSERDLAGKTVHFLGALSQRVAGAMEVVPVSLEVVE